MKEALIKEKERSPAPMESLLEQAKLLLEEQAGSDREINERLKKGKPRNTDIVQFRVTEQANVFDLSHIRTLCIAYRLRFLDSKFFKGEYPYEAIAKIREFEHANRVTVQQFKIVAPTRLFNLIDPNKDPMLFANIGNGKYYFIHKWGNDMPWFRKILAWPMRSINTLFMTLVAVSILIAFSVPKEWLVLSKDLYDQIYNFRMLFLMELIIGGFFILVYIGLVCNKSLSESEWNNKYLR